MKLQLSKLLATTLCALSLVGFTIGTTSVAQAGGYGHHMKCKWVGGYWRHGHYIPKHKVCMSKGYHCKWVGGYMRHGHWIPKHKVCFR